MNKCWHTNVSDDPKIERKLLSSLSLNNKLLCCFTFVKMNNFYRCIAAYYLEVPIKFIHFSCYFFAFLFFNFIRSSLSAVAYVHRTRYKSHILFLHTSVEHWIIVTMKKTANQCQQSATIWTPMFFIHLDADMSLQRK